jgi:hypothetical protein
VLRNAEDLALVLADQRIVGRYIPFADPFDQGYVGMRLEFTCNRLDGRHGGWMREFLWGPLGVLEEAGKGRVYRIGAG